MYIKVELMRRGITLAEIAEPFGLSDSYVSHIIAGRRRNEGVEKDIAARIGVPVSQLFPDRAAVA